MRYVIIEDELPAAEQLRRDMAVVEARAQCVGSYASVAGACAELGKHTELDLILSDIQLSDGLSFDIFERVEVSCPVIFCTAYDEYVMRALSTQGVDYLLKPIERARLSLALAKLRGLEAHFASRQAVARSVVHASLLPGGDGTPKRLLAKRGTQWVALEPEKLAYLCVEHKLVLARTKQGEEFILDGTLSDLEQRLDPTRFFRANRRFLVHIDAVRGFRSLGKGRLGVDLEASDKPLVVSQDNAKRFRAWLEG